MREHKYRAWDKIFKKMIYSTPMAMFNLYDSNHEIMQYTGLHDRLGKEIYEGDVIRYELFSPPKDQLLSHEIGEVRYDENYCMFMVSEELTLGIELKDLEVIGNIYENPELLEQPNGKE